MGIVSASTPIRSAAFLLAGLGFVFSPTQAQADDTSKARTSVRSKVIRGEAKAKAKATPATPKAVASSDGRFLTFADETPNTLGGFHMEGAPKVEVVFGDIAFYRKQVDHFRDIAQQMDDARARFAAATHSAQKRLDAAKTERGCPVDDVAENYSQASQAGLEFRRLGASFESTFQAIRDLDQMGETAGLTPDYRWQVQQSKADYRQALSDLREMRSAFQGQLERELRAQGCHPETLLARASELASEAKVAAKARVKDAATTALTAPEQTVVEASTATFFVDNRQCQDTLRVQVDNTLLGEVAPGTRAAFQSLAGRHTLCLLSADGVESCGDTGSVRSAFIHDGWSVSRHCGSVAKK